MTTQIKDPVSEIKKTEETAKKKLENFINQKYLLQKKKRMKV